VKGPAEKNKHLFVCHTYNRATGSFIASKPHSRHYSTVYILYSGLRPVSTMHVPKSLGVLGRNLGGVTNTWRVEYDAFSKSITVINVLRMDSVYSHDNQYIY
jgi:hypothetical protein